MNQIHVIDDELLLGYAAGAVEEPVALLVATHLALNPAARCHYRRLEALGGALIEEIEPAAVGAGALDALLARLDEPAMAAPAAPLRHVELPVSRMEPVGSCPGALIPRPLRDYIGDDPAKLDWTAMMRGVATADIPVGGAGGFVTRLLRVDAGRAVPRHTHRGAELVLVLDGGFTDINGHFIRGDACVGDETVDHQPVADPDGVCLCLMVSDAPVRLTGPFAWLSNRFVRY